MKFMIGQLVATPPCIEFCSGNRIDILGLVQRHMNGDWGDLDEEDKEANEEALKCGSRILSSYVFPAGKVWIITEAQNGIGIRESTCVLLPEDY
jgi:hypothetical protein